ASQSSRYCANTPDGLARNNRTTASTRSFLIEILSSRGLLRGVENALAGPEPVNGLIGALHHSISGRHSVGAVNQQIATGLAERETPLAVDVKARHVVLDQDAVRPHVKGQRRQRHDTHQQQRGAASTNRPSRTKALYPDGRRDKHV